MFNKLRERLRGPMGHPGPTGPMGCTGEDGYLQLSGFPQGHELCLFDHNKRLVWSVMIGHGTAKVRKFRRYRT